MRLRSKRLIAKYQIEKQKLQIVLNLLEQQLTQTSPSAGSNATLLPGYSGVPLWSVLPNNNKPTKQIEQIAEYIICIYVCM